MKARHRIRLVATALLLAFPPTNARAQVAPLTLGELLSNAKPGRWVRLEGVPQEDRTVRCVKAGLLGGSNQDTGWAIKGLVQDVDTAARQMTVGGDRVRVLPGPKLNSPTGSLRGLSDLKPGMYVKVEGTYGQDSVFVARKVDDQSLDVARKPGSEKKVVHQGRIERADPAQRTIVLMGTTYVLSSDTRVISVAN